MMMTGKINKSDLRLYLQISITHKYKMMNAQTIKKHFESVERPTAIATMLKKMFLIRLPLPFIILVMNIESDNEQ